MPSNFALKAMNTMHRAVLNLSGGRILKTGFGMPVLELTTTGRKSGQKRTVILTSPVQQGDTLVVVGSRGGDPVDPAWVHNVRADGNVEVSLQRTPTRPYTARIATAAERADLWPKVTAAYKGYAGYQEKTDREIPLILLDPA